MLRFIKVKHSQLIFLFASIAYLFTAIKSHGYFHGDEHFQIIEFANFKLGNVNSYMLPWEFQEKIRPTLQVNLVFLLLKSLSLLGITNPINQQIILRLICAILALCSLRYFINSIKSHFKEKLNQIAFEIVSYSIWFFPLLAVRYSSENLSSIFLVLSLGYFFKNRTKNINWTLLGFIIGISFLFRYQIAFAFFGFFIWLIHNKELKINYLPKLLIGFIAAILFGIINDSWFYEKMVFVPWNYFNLAILNPFDYDFGSQVWNYYITSLIDFAHPILGYGILISLLILILFKPKSWVLFIILPFIFFHTLFDHKEIRFLFPIAFLIPSAIFFGIELIPKNIAFRLRPVIITILILFLGLNLSGIGINALKSAGNGKGEIINHIDKQYNNKNINLFYTAFSNPYDPFEGLHAYYYKKNNIDYFPIKNLCEFDASLKDPNEINLLIMRQYDFERDTCLNRLEEENFILKKLSIPNWMKPITNSYLGFENDRILILYEWAN
jgi:phosphatidylinositol glycan class B